MKPQKHARIGHRLRLVRLTLGFRRQAEFGEAMGGFSVGQIGQAECGRNLPTGELLLALAGKGINTNYILTGEGQPLVGKGERIEECLAVLERAVAELKKARGRAPA